MKEFIALNKTSGNFDEKLGFILREMLNTFDGEENFIILEGDLGTGKTSFVNQMAKLLGLPLFVIEGVFVSENNITNIPYRTEFADDSNIEVKSNLVSQLKQAKKMKLKEQRYVDEIKKNKYLIEIVKKYSGLIKQIRKKYDSILVIDDCFKLNEFLLRNIFKNRKIGNEIIPDSVYILYVSNSKDIKIPMDFYGQLLEFDRLTKDEWFNYFKNKFIDNENIMKRVDFKPEVFNSFYEILNDEDIIYYDKHTNISISPRKWEQLLLYININLPVKNKYEAQTLVANVKNYFKNYQTGITSILFNKVLLALTQIINQTSNFNFSQYELDVSDKWIEIGGKYNYKLHIFNWKSLLKQQLKTKIEVDSNVKTKDELIKFIPIIQSFIPSLTIRQDLEEIAKEFDLELIFEPIYDNQTLSKIIKNIKTPTKVKGQGKYKYLIVLDEIYNIDDDKFFYKLKYELLNKPEILDDVLIVFTFDSYIGQMPKLIVNNTLANIANITEARPSWKDLEKNILNNTNKEYIEKLGFDLEKAVFETIKLIFYKFKLQNNWDDFYGRVVIEDENLFYLKIGYNRLYIPPERIYTTVKSLSNEIFIRLTLLGVGKLRQATRPDKELKNILEFTVNDENFENNYKEIFNEGLYNKKYLFGYTKKDQEKFYNAILEEIYQEFETFIIPNSTIPLRINHANSLKIIKEFIFNIPEIKAQFKGLFEKVEYDDVEPLNKSIQQYENEIDNLINSTLIYNYIETHLMYPTKVFMELFEYVKDKINYINNNFKNQKKIINDKELPLEGYEGLLLYTNILKIEQAILKRFKEIHEDEEVYFLFEFSNTIKRIAKLVYEEISNIRTVTYELSKTKEIEKQQEIAQYIYNFLKKLGLDIELKDILNPDINYVLKRPAPKGYFRRLRIISDSFLYEE